MSDKKDDKTLNDVEEPVSPEKDEEVVVKAPTKRRRTRKVKKTIENVEPPYTATVRVQTSGRRMSRISLGHPVEVVEAGRVVTIEKEQLDHWKRDKIWCKIARRNLWVMKDHLTI